MTGSQVFCPHLQCPIKEKTKFDTLVADNTRVWRPPQAILPTEVINDQTVKFCLKVKLVERYIQDLAGML
jgi:hypothetical protein